MAAKAKDKLGVEKIEVLADRGFYICPEGNCLECMTIKSDTIAKRYRNFDACGNCKNNDKCTTAKDGKRVLRGPNEPIAEQLCERLKDGMAKYRNRQNIVEHPFGTIKRTMNFYYLLTRKFKMVRGEVSVAIFTYNLKRVISILGVEELIELIMRKMRFKVA